MLLKEEFSDEYPWTPILKDLEYKFPCPTMLGIITAKAVPDGIVKKLDETFSRTMKEPRFINEIKDLHLPLLYHNNKDLNNYMSQNYEFFKRYFKEEGITK